MPPTVGISSRDSSREMKNSRLRKIRPSACQEMASRRQTSRGLGIPRREEDCWRHRRFGNEGGFVCPRHGVPAASRPFSAPGCLRRKALPQRLAPAGGSPGRGVGEIWRSACPQRRSPTGGSPGRGIGDDMAFSLSVTSEPLRRESWPRRRGRRFDRPRSLPRRETSDAVRRLSLSGEDARCRCDPVNGLESPGGQDSEVGAVSCLRCVMSRKAFGAPKGFGQDIRCLRSRVRKAA
jgi:hypothetical protein